MAESLKGKVAVISGVGSGFGKATAELFAAADQVNLVLIDRNAAALKNTADNCEASGSRVIALECDVTQPETFEAALDAALTNFSKVDFLINYLRRRRSGGAD
ncbi:MAG: SDR family NAD(P)-dependent oxidoreductase [Caldilineales bacterium]